MQRPCGRKRHGLFKAQGGGGGELSGMQKGKTSGRYKMRAEMRTAGRGRTRSVGWIHSTCSRRGAHVTAAPGTEARKRLGGHRHKPTTSPPQSPHGLPLSLRPATSSPLGPTCSQRGQTGPSRPDLITPWHSAMLTHTANHLARPRLPAPKGGGRWWWPGCTCSPQPAAIPHLHSCLTASVFPDAPAEQ